MALYMLAVYGLFSFHALCSSFSEVNFFPCSEVFSIQFLLIYIHFSFRPCWCVCKHDEEKDVPQVSTPEA